MQIAHLLIEAFPVRLCLQKVDPVFVEWFMTWNKKTLGRGKGVEVKPLHIIKPLARLSRHSKYGEDIRRMMYGRMIRIDLNAPDHSAVHHSAENSPSLVSVVHGDTV